MAGSTILVVEDDTSLREALKETLTDAGYAAISAEDGARALLMLERHAVDLIVSDVQMSPVGGIELLQCLKTKGLNIPVVLMTAYGSIEQAVEAMQCGAANYLAKPFEVHELLDMVGHYLNHMAGLAPVAEDPRSQELLLFASRLADNDLTVMISGESGSGKEVYARFIHSHSDRRDEPFIAVNCAAIPENMLEAMLFGYEKGAFTGAHASHPGKFEQAQGGTLLLDEISEMGSALQAKLLRVLQEREVERLGGKKIIDLNVRVLATTNRNLREEVSEGRFREDLFYRLNVLPLMIPPLRERPGDVIPLAKRTLASQARRQQHAAPQITVDAQARLRSYSWPGNVRELENLIQRAQVLAGPADIRVEHLLFESEPHRVVSVEMPADEAPFETVDACTETSLEENLKAHEQEIIFEALRSDGGNREAAASRLGISPRTLRHKLARMRDEGAVIPGDLVKTA